MYNVDEKVQTKNNSQAGINVILACFAVVIYFAVKVFVFKRSFYTNDQLVMRDIASGVYSGESNSHLVYIMAVLGAVFTGLYKLVPFVKWYDLFMLAVYPVCLTLSVFYIVRKFNRVFYKIVATVVVTLMFLSLNEWFIVMNEYTVNAGILCATGLLCFILAEGSKLSSYVPAIVCFVLTLLLRRQMFLMMLPVIVLLACFKIFVAEKRKIVLTAMVTAIICVVCVTIESTAYSSAEWKSFKKYNEARTDIVDFYGLPSFEYMENTLNEVGMDENEYRALGNAIGLIPGVDAETLSIIADESKTIHNSFAPIWPISEEAKYNIRLALHDLKGSLVGKLILASAAFLCFFSILLYAEKEKKSALLCVLTGGLTSIYTVAVIIVFTLIGRFPERISYPLYYANLMILVGLLVFEFSYAGSTLVKRIVAIGYAIICCTLIVLAFPNNHKAVNENAAYWDGYISEAREVQDYCNGNSDNVYYVSGSIANFACDYMLKNSYRTSDNYITMGYWTLGSELFEKRCGRVLEDSLFASLINQKNAYFIMPSDSDKSWLEELYCEYYGEVSIDVIDTIESSLRDLEVYSVTKN